MSQFQTTNFNKINFVNDVSCATDENAGATDLNFAESDKFLSPSNIYHNQSILHAKACDPFVSLAWSLSKRVVDFVGALILLILLSPLLATLYIMVARTGEQVVFGHRRMGKNGSWFTCYKFRTMVPDAELVLRKLLADNPVMRAEWSRDEKLKHDPRVTAVGNFLRKTSLDELPQLFNVVKGEMSLVGPRPITETGVAYYGKAIRLYCAVRPGMTGLWQVSGRNKVHFRRRVAIDVYYVRTQSFLLDIKILFRTVLVVIGANGY